MNQFLVLTTTLALALAACGDSSPAIVTEPAGTNCPNGGIAIESGDSTTYVCNGGDGSDGTNGANGSNGGGTDGHDGSNATAITWTAISADATAQANYGYIVDAAGPMTLTLPPTQGLHPGDDVRLIVHGTGGVSVSPNGAQTFDYDPAQFGWRPGSAPGMQWQSIAMSADATSIFATSQNGVYRSTDAGVTWTPLAAGPHTYLQALAVSANGQVVVVSAWNYGLYYSTDAGTTWSQPVSGNVQYVVSLAMSADGSMMFASDQQAQRVRYSTDFGATWTPYSMPSQYYAGLACSADGSSVVATDQYGNVYQYLSTTGVWNQIATLGNGNGNGKIASSSDGATLVVTSTYGAIYMSNDAGVTWTTATVPPYQWYSVAMSNDGSTILASAASYGTASGIVMSKDAGATWAMADATNRMWDSVAISGDGTIPMAADASNGSICHPGNGSVLASHATEIDFMYEGNGAFFATSVAGTAFGPY